MELESYFVEEFAGRLTFILSDGIPASAEDVQKDNMKRLLNKIGCTVEKAKQRKLQAYLGCKRPVIDNHYEELQRNGSCSYCGYLPRKVGDPEEAICRHCAELIDIGKDLVKASVLELSGGTSLKPFGAMIRIKRADNRSAGFMINRYKAGSPRMFLPYVAPWKDEEHGELCTFEDIAKLSKGTKKLAMFKADIDNLGLIFTSSLGNRVSFSRYAGLSRMLHYFFSGYYAEFIRTHERSDQKIYNQKIYTVFSGGDDLCILGPWDIVLNFASDFRKELNRFTNSNPSITLSGGIALAHPNLPVRNIAREAEAALEEAKSRTVPDIKGIKEPVLVKDGVSVFGVTVSWQEYDQCLADAERLLKYIEDGKLSSGVVYKMIDLANRAKQSKHGSLKDMIWMSSFRYMVARNIEDKTVKEWFSTFGKPENIEKSRIAVSYALYANRKEDGEK